MTDIENLMIKQFKIIEKIRKLSYKKMSEETYNKKYDSLKAELTKITEEINLRVKAEAERIEVLKNYVDYTDNQIKYYPDMLHYYIEERVKSGSKYIPPKVVNYIQNKLQKEAEEEDRINRILGIGKYE